MLRESYPVKYRVKGQIFWRKIKNVIGDQIVYSRLELVRDEAGIVIREYGYEPIFRAFHTDDDSIIYIPLDAEVIFPPKRQEITGQKMSRDVGQPIQRA